MHKKKILNSNPLLFLSMLCIVIIIFLTTSVNVHAQGGNTYTLPFDVTDYRSNNSLFPDGFSNTVLADYLANVTYPNSRDFDPNSMVIIVESVSSSYCQIFLCSRGYIKGDTSDVSSIYANLLYYKTTNQTKACCFRMKYDIDSSGNLTFNSISTYFTNTEISIFGGYPPTPFGNTGLSYQTRYPIYIAQDVYDENNNLVITKTNSSYDEEATFETLDQFLDITSTVSNGIDNSLSDLQNQQGFFTNLITNLKNFFNALKGWIFNGFSNLANNIKNFFGPFLRNIQNKLNVFFEGFEDFKDKFSHFFQIISSIYNLGLKNGEFDLPTLVVGLIVPDVDQLSSIIRSSVVGAIVFSLSTFSANTISFVQSWFNTTPVYIYHIPDFTFHGQTISGLYFDFSWYSTYKPYGDAIISFWLVINYGMFLLRFVPRFLRSAGSGYSEGSDIVDYYDHPDRDDGSYYFENGLRAPSMFDFM